MDKKSKKRLEIINKKLQQLRLSLSGAKSQDDEPGEVDRLEAEIASLEEESRKLRDG